MPLVRLRARRRAPAVTLAIVVALLAAPLAPLRAQSGRDASVPRHEPLSPAVIARSGLYVPAFTAPAPGAWRVAAEVEYGSAIERNLNWPDAYLLDAELARVHLRARRDVGVRAFVEVQGGAQAAFAGVSDAFFERYHDVIGWVMEERDTRPRDEYADRLRIGRLGLVRDAAPYGVQPTDVRVAGGVRHGRGAQTVLGVTLPVARAEAPLGRGVATVSAIHARRAAIGGRTVVQGTAGLGWAPRRGELSSVQRTLLPMGALGVRVRVAGTHGAYASLFVHDAPYGGTGFAELDDAEISVDFGWVWRSRSGREWRIGLTEDTRRRDPGIDLVLKIGVE